jgi:hypothetical protein
MIQSSHPDYHPYTNKTWIVAMQKVYENDGNVFAKYLQRNYPQLYSQGVWIFGDWDNALRAAGFDPEKMRIQGSWDRQKIIKKLQNIRDRKLPLYARYMLKNHAALFSSSRREFGSWNKALRAAGMTKQALNKLHKSRLGTLRSLRDVIETRSKAAIPAVLRSQAVYYFGSLRNALAALKTDERLLSGWSKQKIVTTLLGCTGQRRACPHGKRAVKFPHWHAQRKTILEAGVTLCTPPESIPIYT